MLKVRASLTIYNSFQSKECRVTHLVGKNRHVLKFHVFDNYSGTLIIDHDGIGTPTGIREEETKGCCAACVFFMDLGDPPRPHLGSWYFCYKSIFEG